MNKLPPNCLIIVVSCFALMLASSAGCGGKYPLAPVTGVVTANDKPVEGIEVVFYPETTKDNAAPGPFSVGKTDSDGRFSMVSRDGNEGAFVGVNRIGFELPGASESGLKAAKTDLKEMMGDQEGNREGIELVKKRIADITKTMEQFSIVDPEILSSRSLEVTVPPEGIENHKIDVSKKE